MLIIYSVAPNRQTTDLWWDYGEVFEQNRWDLSEISHLHSCWDTQVNVEDLNHSGAEHVGDLKTTGTHHGPFNVQKLFQAFQRDTHPSVLYLHSGQLSFVAGETELATEGSGHQGLRCHLIGPITVAVLKGKENPSWMLQQTQQV